MRCLPGGQPRIEEPEMAFLTSPCSLPQNLVSIPCRRLINLCRSGLELVWKLLIRLVFPAAGCVGMRLKLDFSPCSQGEYGWDETSARRSLRRLDQHIDAAGGEGELAPGLVVDRHAVLDALGAAEALGVAGDQHRLVRVLRRGRGDVSGHRRDLVLQPGAIDEAG